jgi:Zn-dependent M16 (insulinase) family peptidase
VLIKDFNNLLSVYLDAVFCPLLRELDFLQEGWRLENEELDDKNTPFIIKGKATRDTNLCRCALEMAL